MLYLYKSYRNDNFIEWLDYPNTMENQFTKWTKSFYKIGDIQSIINLINDKDTAECRDAIIELLEANEHIDMHSTKQITQQTNDLSVGICKIDLNFPNEMSPRPESEQDDMELSDNEELVQIDEIKIDDSY